MRSLHTIPVVKQKGGWAKKYANPTNASFGERLVAFAIFEGVFFSGSFCAIYYFKKQGLLPGLTFSNEYIARDEAMHCKFACALYGHLINKLPQDKIHEMFRSAVDIETEFVNEALNVDLIGMNSTLMNQYIRFIADYWIKTLGYEPIFNVENPFKWMTLMSLQGKGNFFEKRISDYGKAINTKSTVFEEDDF